MSRKRKQTPPMHLKGPGWTMWRRTPRASSRRGSRHLFDRWAAILPRLRAAKHLALLLDFDGTLVPIQPHPEKVRLGTSTRRLIARLASRPRLSVWIISGRRLRDLRRRAAVDGVQYVGLHGWEWDESSAADPEDRFLLEAKGLLKERLGSLPGVRIEDKRMSLAVHYRRARAPVVRRARAILRRTLKPFASRLRTMNGKKVWEILSLDVEGKGRAVRLILEKLPEATLPIYLGDDTTDESAFAEIPRGITVHVGGRRRTKARYRLRGPDQVVEFLRALETEFT